MSVSGAGVFLHNGRKVLLVHQRASLLWSIPKGCKEKGECNTVCWKRELAEETGICKIPVHRITGAYNMLKYNITVVELFTDHLPFPVANDDEIIEAKWVDLKEAMRMNINAVTRQILKLYTPSYLFSNFHSCRKLPSQSRERVVRDISKVSWRSNITIRPKNIRKEKDSLVRPF